jgi:hypothetical protein
MAKRHNTRGVAQDYRACLMCVRPLVPSPAWVGVVGILTNYQRKACSVELETKIIIRGNKSLRDDTLYSDQKIFQWL